MEDIKMQGYVILALTVILTIIAEVYWIENLKP